MRNANDYFRKVNRDDRRSRAVPLCFKNRNLVSLGEASGAGEEKLRNKEELNKSKKRSRQASWKGDATPTEWSSSSSFPILAGSGSALPGKEDKAGVGQNRLSL